MYAPTTNMDGERYQDLSELGWFGSEVQPWAAAEGPTTMDVSMHSYGNSQPELAYETSIDYSPTELGPFYSLPRTDSMEDVKAVTAPMEVVPMRQHEAIQVKDFVKTETEDVIAKEEVIEGENDLLAEFGNGDLFDFIFSEGSPLDENKTLSTQSQEPNCKTSAPAEQPKTLPQTTTLPFPQQSKTSSPTPSVSPPLQKNKAMKETYLAIPRELTSDGNKIPKMLILKTPQTSTINFQEMGLSIAERIKIGDKRKRPKKYSDYDHSNDDDDSNEDSNDIDYDAAEDEEHLRPSKRSRRSSTSSTTSDRYRELRDKNNEASRKSRLNRKEKEKDLMNSLSAVEGENRRLKTKSDELERLVHSLRKLLLQIVVSRGSVR